MNNLGQYKKMPPTFQKLQELQDELEKEGYSLDSLGIMLDTDDCSYYVTPCDVITFATTGSDGIHFGLLTDFGCVSDLEDAYVVYISPMDFGSAVFLAARNLKEFIDLLFTMKDSMEIGNFLSIEMADELEEEFEEDNRDNEYGYDEEEEHEIEYRSVEEDEEEIEYEYEDYAEEDDAEYTSNESDDDFLQERDYVLDRLKASLGCKVIEDIKPYYQNLYEERNKQIAIQTKDRIGILPMNPQPITSKKFEVYEDMEIDIQELETFFQRAQLEDKLAFVRDAQNLGIFLDDKEVLNLTLNELRKLGYEIEAERLQRSNKTDLPSYITLSTTVSFTWYEPD